MTGHKIDYDEYRTVKRSLRFHRVATVANKRGLSVSTVMKIRGAKNYDEYVGLVKATHPEIKYSLAEDVLYVHKLMFDKGDNKYQQPATAQKAIKVIIKELKK